MSDTAPPNYEAPEGAVWVCGACFKRAKHKIEGGIDHGWDTSCFTWAVLCDETSLIYKNGRVVSATAIKDPIIPSGNEAP